jgi:serine/threonine protein kinase
MMGKNHNSIGGIVEDKLAMEESCIVEILVQVAMGLRHMHRMNITHRDIKAANILINDAGQFQVYEALKNKKNKKNIEIFN